MAGDHARVESGQAAVGRGLAVFDPASRALVGGPGDRAGRLARTGRHAGDDRWRRVGRDLDEPNRIGHYHQRSLAGSIAQFDIPRIARAEGLGTRKQVPLAAVHLLGHCDGLRAAVPVDRIRGCRGSIAALRPPGVDIVVTRYVQGRPPDCGRRLARCHGCILVVGAVFVYGTRPERPGAGENGDGVVENVLGLRRRGDRCTSALR